MCLGIQYHRLGSHEWGIWYLDSYKGVSLGLIPVEGGEGLRSSQSKKSTSGEGPRQPLLRASIAFRAVPSQVRWSGFPALHGSVAREAALRGMRVLG